MSDIVEFNSTGSNMESGFITHRPLKYFDIVLKDGSARNVTGVSAKYLDDGSLIVFAENREVVAAYGPGEWRQFESSVVPLDEVRK